MSTEYKQAPKTGRLSNVTVNQTCPCDCKEIFFVCPESTLGTDARTGVDCCVLTVIQLLICDLVTCILRWCKRFECVIRTVENCAADDQFKS